MLPALDVVVLPPSFDELEFDAALEEDVMSLISFAR